MSKLSKRLADIVKALPLKSGMRVLEIGCGPGAMAREIVNSIDNIYVLAIDRSGNAIEQAIAGSASEIKSGKLVFRQVSIEKFQLGKEEKRFDLAIAVRVGALDGRHPEIEDMALRNVAKGLTTSGKLFIDKGTTIKEIALDKYR